MNTQMRKIMAEEPYVESKEEFKARMHDKHTKHMVNTAKSKRELAVFKSKQKDN